MKIISVSWILAMSNVIPFFPFLTLCHIFHNVYFNFLYFSETVLILLPLLSFWRCDFAFCLEDEIEAIIKEKLHQVTF